MQISELTPSEFNESLLPIFEAVHSEVRDSKFSPEHFFPTWQAFMRADIARTWFAPGVVLGATFTPCVFSRDVQAHVVFWFSLPEVRGTGIAGKVFEAFEAAAISSGAKAIYGAAYRGLNYEKRVAGYEKCGFEQIESTFRKRINTT